MLSVAKDIKTIRMLCKAITGRTSVSPVVSINKVLRTFSEDYVLEISATNKKTPATPGNAVFQVLPGAAQRGASRRTTLVLPCSIADVVGVIIGADSRAEQDYGLGYGRPREGAVGRS